MQTMTETLMALPLQDDALARRLLQRAQGAFQKWPEGFAGFCAQLQCRTSGRNASGRVQVSPGRRVEVHLPDVELRRLAQTLLARLVYVSVQKLSLTPIAGWVMSGFRLPNRQGGSAAKHNSHIEGGAT